MLWVWGFRVAGVSSRVVSCLERGVPNPPLSPAPHLGFSFAALPCLRSLAELVGQGKPQPQRASEPVKPPGTGRHPLAGERRRVGRGSSPSLSRGGAKRPRGPEEASVVGDDMRDEGGFGAANEESGYASSETDGVAGRAGEEVGQCSSRACAFG